jgi:DNA-directed RNA polymerase beta subunit
MSKPVNNAVNEHTSVFTTTTTKNEEGSPFVPDPRYQDLPITEKSEGFTLIRQLYDQTHFVNHQIDSYNYFITRGMQAIVNREPPIEVNNLRVQFNHVYVDKPKFIRKTRDRVTRTDAVGNCIETTEDAEPIKEGQKVIVNYTETPLHPNEARKRIVNYDGTIYASITVTNTETGKKTEHHQVSIGKLPIMVRSNACRLSENNKVEKEECANDFGGYFIIKGKERVLVGQLRRAYNKVYVERTPEDKYEYMAEIRSMNEQGSSILIQLKINTTTKELFFSLPYIKAKSLLPAGLVFKALGISEDDMKKMTRIDDQEILDMLVHQYRMEVTMEEAIESIANDIADETKDCMYVRDILTKELFYHVGDLTPEKSAQHLGYIIKKLIDTVYNRRALDDKDNLANKRVDGTSSLMAFLFQILFKQFIKTVSNQMESKKNPDPVAIIKDIKTITHVMNQAFMTGNWNTQKSSLFTRVGVSQVLSMQNYGAKMSHLRRIMLPVGKKGKIPSARQLHASHFSFICPYETPEGDTVGLVSNLALSAQISVHVCPKLTTSVVKGMDAFRDDMNGRVQVLVNGHIVGSCDKGLTFVKEFNKYRLSDIIDNSVSIVRLIDENEVHIWTDEGRLLRPLFALGPRNKILYREEDRVDTWNECMRKGKIVFREVWELEQAVVAMTEEDLKKNRCDYLEICPASTMMAVMASVIPLSNHSQSPRNAYQASMGKQAIGIPSTAYQQRYDTTLHVLDTPQTPLTKNEMMNVLHFDEMSHGAVPIVAIMTYRGYNQEDSVILNKGSLDRGLFRTTTYKTISEEEKKRGSSVFESICLPKFQYRNSNYDYSHLNEDGLVWKKNTFLKKGTVIIGRTTKKMIKKDDGTRVAEITDSSVVIKHGEEGYLDKVLNTLNSEGVRVIKVRIRIPRIPEIGDKFASSTAQKGTCGMIFPEEDMPFDKDGVKPDLIINPHAIPSRMTINMLIEMCFNLVGCKLGVEMDATPFKHRNIEDELMDWAKRAGIETYATTMMDGATGEIIPSKIFMAPCFYQRLKHMVADKIHARVTGPLDTLTHQPVAGRSRDGGLRFGEMEKDCMLSHGSTRVLKECLFDKSDKYAIPVCMGCGNVPDKRDFCDGCQEGKIEMKDMPYATKLLYQELLGMGMNLKIN